MGLGQVRGFWRWPVTLWLLIPGSLISAATGDRFAMYGFSSRKRDPIRFHQLKAFDESYNAGVRGRINEIKPGYYTRMGTAIRHASGLLADQQAGEYLPHLFGSGGYVVIHRPSQLPRELPLLYARLTA
jgi:nitric oxide reductase NorD protein